MLQINSLIFCAPSSCEQYLNLLGIILYMYMYFEIA